MDQKGVSLTDYDGFQVREEMDQKGFQVREEMDQKGEDDWL